MIGNNDGALLFSKFALFEWKSRGKFPYMHTLAEIEAAAESLTPEQKEELLRFLARRIHRAGPESSRARLVRRDGDVLLEAPPGAPPMTPANVKQILENWP